MASLKVGQILFVVPKGQAQLIPIQVVEEITKRTLKGQEVSYVVRIDKEGKTADIASINGEIFETATWAQKTLIERSSNGITKMVEQAVANAAAWYPQIDEPTNELTIKKPDVKSDVGDLVTLPDGTRARVKLPEGMK